MAFTTSITVGGQPVVLSVPRGSKAWQRANAIFAPVGPAPSRAWLLMTRAALLELSDADAHSIVWTQRSDGGQEGSRTLTFAGFYLVNAERLLPGDPGDTSALYLVELADARHLAARKSETGSIIRNIRSYANNADYLTGTSGTTWTSLATELWDACEFLGAFPGLPFAPDDVPQNNWFIGLNAWRALCAFLDQLDCAVDHNPLAGTYSIVQLGAAQAVADHADTLQLDTEPFDFSTPTVADTVRVYFTYHRKAYGQERDKELANNWAFNGQGDVIDAATGVAGASGTKALWDDLPWILDETGVNTNAAALSTRATARAARYALRQTVAPQHRIHAGLVDDILPGAQVRAVLWRNWDDAQRECGGTVTEFVAKAELVTSFAGYDFGPAWFDSDLATPEREAFSPPDLARHSYPVYPRLPEIVQVNASGASAGDSVQPNGDGFHRGRVRRWTDNAMATLDDCWIRFVDDHDTLAGQVSAINGEFYGPARLSGVTTSGGSLLPVYTVRRGAGSSLVRFRLTADLPGNNTAGVAAVIRTFNGAAYADGTAIKVFDWWAVSQGGRGMWQAIAGMEGWAWQREQNADTTPGAPREYDIVWMEVYAYSIEFTLQGDLYPNGYANATVTASWEQGVAPGATVVVHDDQSRWPDAITNCKGTAIRSEYADAANPTVPYYKIVSCTRAIWQAQAGLGGSMCGDVPSVPSWTPLPIGEHQVDPGVGTLTNPHGHYGMNGDTVWLVRTTNAPPFTWAVRDVTKHTIPVLSTFSGGCSGISVTGYAQVAVEMCTDAQTAGGIGFVAREVMINAYDGGDAIYGQTYIIYTPCEFPGSTFIIAQTSDCSGSSGFAASEPTGAEEEMLLLMNQEATEKPPIDFDPGGPGTPYYVPPDRMPILFFDPDLGVIK